MENLVYDLVTKRVLDALSKGVVPWRKPWREKQLPKNAVSGRTYRGVNLLLLGLSEFFDHRWLTMRQANELGGEVIRGSKASLIVFWKRWTPQEDDDDETSKQRAISLLRYYHVFNVEQCEGLDVEPLQPPDALTDRDRLAEAEGLVKGMPDPPTMEEKGESPWYSPSRDVVRIPPLSVFDSAGGYYATLFHELGHATGHVRRLARKGVMDRAIFGSDDYSREELVAEMTSAFCCASVGLDNSIVEDSARYVASWLRVLETDHKAVVVAAAQAQRAADFIRGQSHTEEVAA